MKLRSIFCVLALLGAGVESALAQTTTWTGANGAWSVGGNWSNGIPAAGDTVIFDTSVTTTVDAAYTFTNLEFTGGTPILSNSSGSLSASNGIFYSGGTSVAINVPIVGTGNLWLNGGNGTVTLNPGSPGANTYSGSTEVFAGATLTDGQANSYSANSVMYVGGTGGGTLQVNFNESIAGLNDGGANGSVLIASGKTLTLTGAFSTTFSGVISGSTASLVVNGPSTQTLEGANTYGGTTTINSGGGLNIGGGTATGSIVSNVTGAGSISFDRSNAYTYGGTLSGSLAVVQQGVGTTTLSGTNTYTGATTVNSGQLQAGSTSAFGGTGNSAVTVNSSGTLSLGGFDNQIGSLAGAGSVALGSNTLTVGNIFAGATVFSGTITGAGSLNMAGYVLDLTNANTYAGGTTVTTGTLEADNSSGSATGTGPITILSSGTLQIGNGGSDTNGSINGTVGITDNGTLEVARSSITVANNISGTGGVTQIGNGTTTLTGTNTYSGTTTAFRGVLQAGSTSAFGTLSDVSFPFAGTLDLNGYSNSVGTINGSSGNFITLGSATLTLANPTGSSNFGGTISGTGSLVLDGSQLTVTGANTYSGSTTINNGVLLAANASGSATGTGPITVANGTTLEIGANGTAGSVAAPSITDNGFVLLSRSDANTLAANISGTGSVHAYGSGSFTLTGTNTYSGETGVESGQLIAGSTSAFGGAGGESNVYLSFGGQLVLGSGYSNTVGTLGGDNSGVVQLNGANLTLNGTGGTTFSGTITGTGGLVLSGSGITTLDGANNYSGGTTINSGTLAVGDTSTPGASIAGNVLDDSTLLFQPASSDNITYSGAITGTGAVTFSGYGTITFSGNNSYSGLTSVNSGTLADALPNAYSSASQMLVNTDGTLDVNFNETVANIQNGSSGGNIVVASGANLTSLGAAYVGDFTGAISGGGSLTLNGGVQGLGGNNTFTGGVTVTNSAELFVSSNTAVGTGTLTFGYGADELSPDGTNITLSNPIALQYGGGIDNDDGGALGLTLTGNISGISGDTGIVWCTPGTLTLTGNNSFFGGIDMREGILLLGTDTAAGSGTITLDTGTILAAYGGPGVTRTVDNNISLNGSSTEFGNVDNNNLILNGTITGEASITYAGGSAGTLTLNNDNSGFNGPFTISSGTVIAGNNNAFGSTVNTVFLAGSGNAGLNVVNGVTINNDIITSGSANVISGNGTIGYPFTVDGTVVLSPSASPGGGPGNLTFTGPMTLATGGAIHFDLYDATGAAGTGYSLITASGGLSLTASANTLTFNVVTTDAAGNAATAIHFNPANSYSWNFATSPTAITGFSASQFNIITSGFLNGTGGGTFSITGSTNDLTLNFTPVPEPSTWALIAAGVLAVVPFAARRRRRRLARVQKP